MVEGALPARPRLAQAQRPPQRRPVSAARRAGPSPAGPSRHDARRATSRAAAGVILVEQPQHLHLLIEPLAHRLDVVRLERRLGRRRRAPPPSFTIWIASATVTVCRSGDSRARRQLLGIEGPVGPSTETVEPRPRDLDRRVARRVEVPVAQPPLRQGLLGYARGPAPAAGSRSTPARRAAPALSFATTAPARPASACRWRSRVPPLPPPRGRGWGGGAEGGRRTFSTARAISARARSRSARAPSPPPTPPRTPHAPSAARRRWCNRPPRPPPLSEPYRFARARAGKRRPARRRARPPRASEARTRPRHPGPRAGIRPFLHWLVLRQLTNVSYNPYG